MQRMGMVIGIGPDKIIEYKDLHAAVWPQVLETPCRAQVRNCAAGARSTLPLINDCTARCNDPEK